MIGFQPGASHVALFFCVLAVFSATVGALSMAVTVGFGTAGKAALIMNLVRSVAPSLLPALSGSPCIPPLLLGVSNITAALSAAPLQSGLLQGLTSARWADPRESRCHDSQYTLFAVLPT
jgi:hypothetical protein